MSIFFLFAFLHFKNLTIHHLPVAKTTQKRVYIVKIHIEKKTFSTPNWLICHSLVRKLKQHCQSVFHVKECRTKE